MSDATPSAWKPIDTAPKGEDILVFTQAWGTIIVNYSEEFCEWLSRMQVPVSIKEDHELPSHWQPLPTAPEGVEIAEKPNG